MVSVVNGYVCFSSCDEAKAKQGKNPSELPGTQAYTDTKKPSDVAQQPSVIFDGALKGISPSPASADRGSAAQGPSLNILA